MLKRTYNRLTGGQEVVGSNPASATERPWSEAVSIDKRACYVSAVAPNVLLESELAVGRTTPVDFEAMTERLCPVLELLTSGR